MTPRVYRLLLRALPAGFRRRRGAELEVIVAERLRDAYREGGPTAYRRRALAELLDLARTALALRAAALHPARAGGELRAAARALARSPGFTALAALTLALGVGGATTMFGVLDAVLLRPLPHPDSGRLAMVWRTVPRYAFERSTVSYPDFLDWRAGARPFAELAAYGGASATLLGSGPPELLAGARVTGTLFATLGDRPALGRPIEASDDAPGAERVVVLGDALWRRRFGADSAVLGRDVELNDQRYRVVGVMPRGFVFPSSRTEYWTALRMDPASAKRDLNMLTAIARLRPGVDVRDAQARMETVVRRVAAAHPGANEGAGVRVESRHDYLVGGARRALLVLAGASALLLLIACANLASLQLVRATTRRRELAVRAALGAGRARLLRALLAEGVLLALLGGGVGAALAAAATRALVLLGPDTLPRRAEIGVDPRALAFALGASLLCAAACAVGPALGLVRRPPNDALARGARATAGRATRRAHDGLIVAQLALALVLLVGASLLGRSLHRLLTVPVGFDGARVLTAHVSLPRSRYDSPARAQAFFDALLARAAAIPGVEVASGTWSLPFSDDFASGTLLPAEDRGPGRAYPTVAMVGVRAGYFRAIGARLLRGRDLDARDATGGPPVAVVNEALARRFWPGADAVGRRLVDPDEPDAPITVVGVVGDLRSRALDVAAEPEVYLPHAQTAWAAGALYLTLRTSGDPAAAAPALRAAVWSLDPALPVTRVGALAELVSASAAAPRFRTLVVGTLAALAGALALVGIWGVIAYGVAQRTREIGVRIALGAARSRVLGEVLSRGMALTLLGVALGLGGAAVATRALRTLLFGVAPIDPVAYLAAVAALGAAAFGACWLPARRAARVDPVTALRDG